MEFRLREISNIKNNLEKERDERTLFYKKYKRGVNIATAADTTLTTLSIALGASGVGLLLSVAAAPVAIGIEVGAGLLGVVGLTCKFIHKKLMSQAMKHNEIRVLAESKLNTINDLISKALEDDKISDEEFSLILAEVEKFNAMKTDIKSKHKTQLLKKPSKKLTRSNVHM